MRAAAPLVAFAVVAALGFDNGGFFPRSWLLAGVALLWALALVLLLADPALTRRAALWIGLLAAFVGWTALSLVWSVDRDATLDEVRRGLVYVAAAALFSLLARRPDDLVASVWAAAVAVVLYALVRYLLEPGFRDEAQAALLARPVGYANALAILAGMALLLALGLALRVGTLRSFAAASVAPLAAAIVLTESRATVLAVALGVLALALSDRGRLLPLLALV